LFGVLVVKKPDARDKISTLASGKTTGNTPKN